MPRPAGEGKGGRFCPQLRALRRLSGPGMGAAAQIAAQKANLPIGKRQGRGYQAPKLTPGGVGHDFMSHCLSPLSAATPVRAQLGFSHGYSPGTAWR
jgi:hypothetical protein